MANDQAVTELMRAANRAHAEGRFEDCREVCVSVLQLAPDHLEALVLAGIAAAKAGNSDESVQFFQRAIKAAPKCAPAHLWLSMTYRSLGRHNEALTEARDAVRLNPQDSFGQHHLGLCLMDADEVSAAESLFRRAIAMAPNVAVPYLSLGFSLRRQGRNTEAIAAFRTAIQFDRNNLSCLTALREALQDEGLFAEAIRIAKAIVDLEPDSAEANLWLVRALNQDNRGSEAEAYLNRALYLGPDSAAGHLLLGEALQSVGRNEEAEPHFRESIELEPRQGSAYLYLVRSRRVRESDGPLVDRISSLIAGRDISEVDRSQLHYALGKAMEDLGDGEAAMEHFDEANPLAYATRFGARPYDRSPLMAYERGPHRLGRESAGREGSTAALPIFVVGMIRSGTTLVEQILSSHPQVGGVGEQAFWLESGGPEQEPDGQVLAALAATYERKLRGLCPGMERVVDKMPMNYLVLGRIHRAFPSAKIIHVRRDPVDTCLSIYTTPNQARLGWIHKKADIVFAYQLYLRMMGNWKMTLPRDSILEVRYEDLVADPETTIRSLIAFCGLDWHEECLHPEKNKRAAATPSTWQVKQPIYKTSVGRRRFYERWLGAFSELI